jgi:hypothetical protein
MSDAAFQLSMLLMVPGGFLFVGRGFFAGMDQLVGTVALGLLLTGFVLGMVGLLAAE